MDASILSRIRQSFNDTPDDDARAKIGPRAFLIALMMAMVNDSGQRTIAGLRRQIISSLNETIARSTFWQRLSSKRLTDTLSHTIRRLVGELAGSLSINQDILAKIGVANVYLHDASSVTLPSGAKSDFPAPRSNVIPAAIKWHLCLNLFSGIGEWFCLTDAKTHDRNGFPPLGILKGALIIFDLGYWDYQLLADLLSNGVHFLSRVKDKALIEITGIAASTKWKQPLGQNLFSLNWKTFRGNVIEFMGTVHLPELDIDVRIIGFWNNASNVYHWYATNLPVPADMIYPLYRLRWQVELMFKTEKSSLSLDDAPSANFRIIVNLMLASITANLIAQPLARMTLQNATKEVQAAISVQRAGFVFIHVAAELVTYLLFGVREALNRLKKKLLRYATELVDPNFKHRPTSMRRFAIV